MITETHDELTQGTSILYTCDECGAELNSDGRMVINTHSEKEYCYACFDELCVEEFTNEESELYDPDFDPDLFRKNGYNSYEHRDIIS